MSKKKVALGRGLSALLGDTPKSDRLEESPPPSNSGGINEIPIGQIEVNPFQPRSHFEQESLKELAASIKVHGIIQPITVRKLTHNQFQLITGERRFQAAKLAELKAMPAYVRSADDQQMLEMALIENIQRENLNPIEVALSYRRLISEINLKQEELGDRVGKNRSTVTNYLRLLKLPPDIQIALRDNKLSMGHARTIISVENSETQLFIFNKIVKEDLSVRKVEELVRQLMTQPKVNHKENEKAVSDSDRRIKQLQSTLSTHFGTKVNMKSDGKKGEIQIPFLSIEDLNRILEILKV